MAATTRDNTHENAPESPPTERRAASVMEKLRGPEELDVNAPSTEVDFLILALAFTGIVFPLLACLISYPDNWHLRQRPAEISWATLPDLAVGLLSHLGMAPLYPFLACSMTAAWWILQHGARGPRRGLVRAGAYSGVLLAAEYSCLFAIAVTHPRTLGESLSRILMFHGSVVAFTVALVGICYAIKLGFRYVPFLAAIVAILLIPLLPLLLVFITPVCATTWCLIAYVVLSVEVWRWSRPRAGGARNRLSLAQLLGIVGWFAAHCAAWRLAVQLVLSENGP